jgi:hypothetical protein
MDHSQRVFVPADREEGSFLAPVLSSERKCHDARAGRARNRIQAAEADISEVVLNEFSADEQAFVEAYAGKTFADIDP